jgi:hypothetical protein
MAGRILSGAKTPMDDEVNGQTVYFEVSKLLNANLVKFPGL